MKTKWIAFFLTLLLLFPLHGNTTYSGGRPGRATARERKSRSELGVYSDDPFEMLEHTKVFVWQGVGYAPTARPEILALKKLCEQPDSKTILLQLFDTADIAGKLYALCGLYFLDNSGYYEKIETLRETDIMIWTGSGCRFFRIKASKILFPEDQFDLNPTFEDGVIPRLMYEYIQFLRTCREENEIQEH